MVVPTFEGVIFIAKLIVNLCLLMQPALAKAFFSLGFDILKTSQTDFLGLSFRDLTQPLNRTLDWPDYATSRD
jgi:hypothetical protein